MMVSAIVRALVTAGASPEMILAAVEAAEAGADALAQRRANDAVRQKRRREKLARNVTSRDGHVTSRDPPPEEKGVPAPLPKTQTPTTPPLSPPAAPKSLSSAEQIWAMQPPKFRRSTRPDVAKAHRAALKRGGDPEAIDVACRAYYAMPTSREDGGKFAKGAAVLLAEDRWRDFLPTVEPPRSWSPTARAQHLDHFQATGEWRPEWGDQPEERAA